MRVTIWLIILSAFFPVESVKAQGNNLGSLPIKNFAKKIYTGGTQNWSIQQDKQGIMYFGNNDGLLSYDGTFWTTYPIENKTIVRSVHINGQGKIFVGGQGELGYFFPNEQGILTYQSLNPFIPEDQRNFADVWHIHTIGDDVFFQTGATIFRYREGQQFDTFKTGGAIEFSGVYNNQLYIKDNYKGILRFEENAFVIVPCEKVASPITSFLPIDGGKVLVSTLKDGLFHFDGNTLTPWATPHDDFIKEKRVYCASLLDNQNIALGTTLGGVLIIDKNGNAIRQINKETGLQNSNILSLFVDRVDNIWLGLDNGIDYIEYESPYTYLYPDNELEGTGYTVKVKDGKIYFGTSNGLYQSDWKSSYDPFEKQQFQLVPYTAGQVWGISSLGDDLILNSHEGAFQLKDGAARKIVDFSTWMMVPINDRLALCGDYNGLSIFKKEANKWQFSNRVNGLEASSRILVREKNGTMWMSHPYRGIYKLDILPDLDSVQVDFYNSEQGLPSDLINYVFDINGKAIFATKHGVYQYLETEDKFAPYPILDDYLGDKNWIKTLSEDQNENVWFSSDEGVGYLEIKEDGLQKSITKKLLPGLDDKLVGGFEYIYPYDANNIFFGSEKGFIRFDSEKTRALTEPITIVLNSVYLLGEKDSIIFGGFFTDGQSISPIQSDNIAVLKPNENNLQFNFSSPSYLSITNIEYQTRMKGMKEEWTSWSRRSDKEYNNLEAGNYTFQVRGKDASGHISEPLNYAFEVKPPWYTTLLAYAIYALLAVGLFFGIMYIQRNRFETEKEQLKSEHEEKEKQQQQIVEQTEEELNSLRNEQLKKEIQFQKKELASATMHIMQKGEMIKSIREQLSKAIHKKADAPQIKKDVEKIIRMLQQDSILDDSWEQFTLHFDQVHSDFLKNLRTKYPQLTNYDQKICAYLRMNLSTKEIATLMNISVRGVEGSRYRLRKKLEIPKEVNLVKFIQEI